MRRRGKRRIAFSFFVDVRAVTPERVERPGVIAEMVPQDVQVVIVGADSEALVARAVPPVEDLDNFVGAPHGQRSWGLCAGCERLGRHNEGKAEGTLVGFIARVTLDLEKRAQVSTAHWTVA
jgi:hypothetical protein